MDYTRLVQITNPKTLIDVGAHLGEFTKNILKITKDCQVVMVEANPKCEIYLKETKLPYDITALSNFNGTSELYIQKINQIGSGSSLYRENTSWYSDGEYDIINVPVSTLDDKNYFSDNMIDLVKLDVQGSELDILYGGRKTIKRTKYVLIEVSLIEYNLGAPLMDIIVNKMKEFGFGINDILEYHKLQNNQIFQLDILFKNSYID